MRNEQTQVRDSDAKEFFELRIAELRTSLATLEHAREHGEDAEFVRLNDAYIEASRAREAFDRRVNERAIDDAAANMPTASFRWGFASIPAMLWLCPCGAQNQSINPQLKAAWEQGARPKVLVRCPTCNAAAKLIESSILLASSR